MSLLRIAVCVLTCLAFGATGLRLVTEKPTVGVCLSGHVRTFLTKAVHESILEHAIGSLRKDFDTSVFFYVSEADDVKLPQWKSLSLGGNEKKDSELSQILGKFEPTRSTVLEVEPAFKFNNKCERSPTWDMKKMQRWYGQWSKVGHCYDLIEEYEKSTNKKFDYLVRLRPDLIWIEDFNATDFVRRDVMVVPHGMSNGGPGTMNDHIVACPRKDCEHYFKVSDVYNNCEGSWDDADGGYDKGIDDGGQLLANRLRSRGVTVVTEPKMQRYTIYRTCDSGGGPECRRIGHPTTRNTVGKKCEELRKKFCPPVEKVP